MHSELVETDSFGDNSGSMKADAPYVPPTNVRISTLHELLSLHDGNGSDSAQQSLFGFSFEEDPAKKIKDHEVFIAGDLSVLARPSVSIVGTRKASTEGAARARKLARGMTGAGITVVSGLAYGIDTEALNAAVASGGKAVGVIGTPIDKASPTQNARLQEEIYNNHLLITQFHVGERVYPSNFPKRNKLMAAISDGTIVIEASDTSGTLHQSAECRRLGRWLFILRSVVDNKSLTWPAKFLNYEKCVVVDSIEDIVSKIS